MGHCGDIMTALWGGAKALSINELWGAVQDKGLGVQGCSQRQPAPPIPASGTVHQEP